MPPNILNNLNSWFRQRPKWLQEAAGLLLENGHLTDEDIETLFDRCLREVGSLDAIAAPSFPQNAFQAESVSPLRLCAISNVKGINALAPRSPLDFGSGGMAVVYGGNGSGKSGYVRILKHICGARNPGALHSNVYSEDGVAQSVDIKYKIDDEEHCVSWTAGDGVQADLNSVDIYDTECGRMYLENESEVTYEPPALQFFSDLTAVCERVAGRIENKLQSCASKKPQMPNEHADTEAGKWYSSLGAVVGSGDLVRYTKWDGEDEKSVRELQRRLAENSPLQRANELLAKKKYADDLIYEVEDCLSKLSDNNCLRILSMNKDMLIKRKAAKAVADNVFSEAPLKGIGTDVWKLLWEHARRYSEEYAYPGEAFPHLTPDARCVLCHQSLSQDASHRLASFEEFVKGQAEKNVKDAENTLKEAMTAIGDVPSDQTVMTRLDAAGFPREGHLAEIVELLKTLQKRREKILEVESLDALPGVPDSLSWLVEMKKHASVYGDTAKRCQEDVASDNRSELNRQLRDLMARKWLSEQREALQAELERLRVVDRLQKAKRLTDTRGISRKKGEIADSLISEAFVQRFRDELTEFGASGIKVELVQKRVERGRVLHELRLDKARSGAPHDVLSEGEHRIVSLAAFLADVTGKEHPTPFVFDDPISSLDQDFEEAVVQRHCVHTPHLSPGPASRFRQA